MTDEAALGIDIQQRMHAPVPLGVGIVAELDSRRERLDHFTFGASILTWRTRSQACGHDERCGVLFGRNQRVRAEIRQKPHQFGVGVGFGSGRMEIAQQAGADAMGYRGTAGPYTVLEAAYRYSAGPVTSVGVAFTTHFFTHVEAIGDFGRGGGPFPYGVMSFFSLMADVGLHVPIF